MKIFIIIRGDSLRGGGGAERRFVRLFNHISQKEDNLYLLINQRLFPELINSGLVKKENKRIIFPENSDSLIGFNFWLIDTINVMKPDVLHLVLMQKSLIPFYLWLFGKRKIAIVQTIANSGFSLGGKLPVVEKYLGYLLFSRSNILDSLYPNFLRTSFGSRYANKVRTSPGSFVDSELFKPEEQKEKIITFAGRLIPEKNPYLVIDAIKIISERNPNLLRGWKIRMLGSGPLKQTLLRKIGQYHLDRLISIEEVYSTHTVLNKSLIFLSMQSTDNYPSQSLLEAMASGNAIIASDVGHTRLLVNKDMGLLVNLSADSLCLGLEQMLRNEDNLKLMGINARKHIINNFDIDKISKYFYNLWVEAKKSIG